MPNYRDIAIKAARQAGIDPYAFVRQMKTESGLRPGLTSSAGAQGIAQIMPSTARAWGVNPNDPVASLKAAAQHMGQYEKQTGSLKGALEMYNLGHTAPDAQLPSETRNYIKAVAGGGTSGGMVSSSANSTPLSRGGAPPANPNLKTQIALSMLGFGNGSGSGTGGLDPMALAMTGKPAKEASPASAVTPSSSPAPYGKAPGGVASFDGKPVDKWIAQVLQKARQTGIWKGTVNSGYRTYAKQAQLYQAYLHGGNIAAKPGQSNHEFTSYPGGAVDVSDPQGLNKALQALGINRLKWAVTHGLADTPHFSSTGH